MRIGYAKMGRSMTLDPDKYGPQGDAEAPQLLERLALRNPDVEWVIVGKHGKVGSRVFPPNVKIVWPDELPRARWNAKGKGNYFCSFCRETLNTFDVNARCQCERGNQVRDAELVLIETMRNLDGMVVHLGQHGTSQTSIPQSNDRWDGKADSYTNPQVWARNYAGFLVEGLNALGDRTDGKAPVSWICTDPRNYMKARDVKWPTGLDRILSQYQWSREQRHERYLDPRTPELLGFDAKPLREGELWLATHRYRHANLELMILPDDWETWGQRDYAERNPIGVATTAFWDERPECRRSFLVKRYLVNTFAPHTEIFGKWDDKSVEDVDGYPIQSNTVEQFPDVLGSWMVTVALPPPNRSQDGPRWTAAKPFQCFAARTACFMLGELDAQGWVLPSRAAAEGATQVASDLWSVRTDWTEEELHLARWLRVGSPEEFAHKAHAVMTSVDTWRWITDAQRRTLARRWNERYTERVIEHQLGIGGT